MKNAIVLNGWQRLWVVLGTVYLAVVVAIYVLVAPTAESVSQKYVAEAVSSMKRADPTLPDLSADQIRGYYKDLSTDTFLTKAIATWSKRDPELIEIENRRQAEIQRLPLLWLEDGLIAFLAWVGPLAAMYLIGWSIGWVRKGFVSDSRA